MVLCLESTTVRRNAVMQVEAVLFDLFDTLVLIDNGETYYEPSLRRLHEFLVKNGVNVAFDRFRHVYFEVRDRFYSESQKTLEEPHFNCRVSQTLQSLGYDFDASDQVVVGATMAFADEFMRYVRLDNSVLEVLKKLHKKYKLGVVSNFAIPECGWRLLQNYGLKAYFDVVVISGEVNRRKPSPEIFERALKALGVNASKTVFVGDTLDMDVKGPKNVGMKTVLVKRRPVEDIVDTKPDFVIKNLNELFSVLHDC
jgi:HAD superfamily hydrolase (TIGR01509 family)